MSLNLDSHTPNAFGGNTLSEEANGLVQALEARRGGLRQCLMEGDRIEFKLAPQGDVLSIEPRCGTESALACVREHLQDVPLNNPFIVDLYRHSSAGDQRTSLDVRGSLSKTEIRAVIQSQISDVRRCYEDAMIMLPDLHGRVQIKFVIGGAGEVLASSVEENQLGNDEVACCINHALRTWRFPKPDGCGIVVVLYPFVLKS